jgi:hypothetical protein
MIWRIQQKTTMPFSGFRGRLTFFHEIESGAQIYCHLFGFVYHLCGVMISTIKTKPYILGLSIGTIWLTAAGAGFAILSIAKITNARIGFMAVLVIAGALLALSVRQIVPALKLPRGPRSPEDRRIGRQFALIVALEAVAIALVSTAYYFTGHLSWLVPLVLIIVGIHFLPLAKLFGVPRYTTLGLLFCIVSISTLLLVPAHAHIGATSARFVYCSLGCAASAWLISVGNLLELRRLLR